MKAVDAHADIYDIFMLTHTAHKMFSSAYTHSYNVCHLFMFLMFLYFLLIMSSFFLLFMFPSFHLFIFSGAESFDPLGALRRIIFDPPVSMNAIGEC
jgi:hypothetical protein